MVEGEIIKYGPGQVIVNEGEHSTDLFILNSGTVSVFKGPTKIVEITEHGALLGEMSLFIGEHRSATMIAETAVELEKITKENITDYFRDNPDFAVKVASSLATKLSNTTKHSQELEWYKDIYDEIEKYASSHQDLKDTLVSLKRVEEWKEQKLRDLLNQKSLMSEKFVRPFVQNTLDSFRSFLKEEVTKGDPFVFGEKEIALDAASVVNLIGECKGWYIMAFPKDSALEMTEKIMHHHYTELNEDVVNFIKEINNIIIGWIIGGIEGYKFTISTPTTIFGAVAVKNMIGSTPSLVVPFNTPLGEFYTIIFIDLVKKK